MENDHEKKKKTTFFKQNYNNYVIFDKFLTFDFRAVF